MEKIKKIEGVPIEAMVRIDTPELDKALENPALINAVLLETQNRIRDFAKLPPPTILHVDMGAPCGSKIVYWP